MKILGKFPSTRLRRVRNSPWIRRLIAENNLSTNVMGFFDIGSFWNVVGIITPFKRAVMAQV